MLKNKKGITLIALIVTIIILLLIAGITISSLIGSGLFEKTQEAEETNKKAKIEEDIKLAIMEIAMEEVSKGNNLTLEILANGQLESKLNGIKVKLEENKITGEYEGCVFEVDEKYKVTIGSTLQVEKPVEPVEPIEIEKITLNKTNTKIGLQKTETLTATITPNDATNKNIIWTSSDESIATVENGTITAISLGTATITATAQDGSGVSANCEVTVYKPVKLSDKAKLGDYVAYNGGNGYTGLWRVLYNNSKYGLQIISAKNVKKVKLGATTESGAKSSYNSAVNTLNTEARKYVNSSYAISGRCVGSDPLNPNDSITEKLTLGFKYKGSNASGCKIGDENYKTDYDTMKKVTNLEVIGAAYWLASRISYTSDTQAWFSVRWVYSTGTWGSYGFWKPKPNGTAELREESVGLRPVITLASDIEISGGDGSEGDAFKLVEK